jgi:hypothetical protein
MTESVYADVRTGHKIVPLLSAMFGNLEGLEANADSTGLLLSLLELLRKRLQVNQYLPSKNNLGRL